MRRRANRIVRDTYANGVLQWALVPGWLRKIGLRLWGVQIGRSEASPNLWFGSNRVKIGDDSFVNREVLFDALDWIEIGDGCAIGMGVKFVTSSHSIGPASARAGASTAAPIRVRNGVWIGAGATILGGVTVGEGSIVAAGAVVLRDVPANVIVGGVPAKEIRALSTDGI